MQGSAEVPKERIEAIQRGYGALEDYLKKTKFLASDRLTVADLCVFAWMESITQVVEVDVSNYPKITAWLAAMRKLPYYEEANKAGADLHIKLFRDALERNKKK